MRLEGWNTTHEILDNLTSRYFTDTRGTTGVHGYESTLLEILLTKIYETIWTVNQNVGSRNLASPYKPFGL